MLSYDCGNIINPMIVQGQVHGGLRQGIAPAMYEELIYDEEGNILNGTLMDYLVPTQLSRRVGKPGIRLRHRRITRLVPKVLVSRPR